MKKFESLNKLNQLSTKDMKSLVGGEITRTTVTGANTFQGIEYSSDVIYERWMPDPAAKDKGVWYTYGSRHNL